MRSIISADAGAMPVRIKIPKEGLRLDYSRYWIEGKQKINISCFYLRSWLRIPIRIILAILLATCLLMSSTYFYSSPKPKFLPLIGLSLFIIILWPAYRFSGLFPIIFGLAMGFIAIGFYWQLFPSIFESMGTWAGTLNTRFQARERYFKKKTFKGTIWHIIIIFSFSIFCLMLLNKTIRLLFLLFNPLGG